MAGRTLAITLLSLAAWAIWLGWVNHDPSGPKPPPAHSPPPPSMEHAHASHATQTENVASVTPAQIANYGYCEEDDANVERTPRPPLSSLLSLDASELMDQVKNAYRNHTGSASLKQALTSFFASPSPEAVQRLAQSPDRVQDGFDYAAAAAIVLGTQAMGHHDYDVLDTMAKLATRLAPSQASAQVLAALAARQRGDTARERQALKRALREDPSEPTIALALGEALANTADLHGAISALSNYLEQHPEDVQAGQLRQRLRLQMQLQRDMESLMGGGITLIYPAELVSRDQARQTHEKLLDALRDAALFVDMPRRAELTAVIYRDRADLIASTCVPRWTDGVFDGILRVHAKTVDNEERGAQVIRHEVFHAQLRSLPLDAPHWFHEGGAQYFAHEMGPSHLRSFRFMVKHRAHIPIDSMDGSFLVIEGNDDARLAYHQSLAMVQMLIARDGPQALAKAVAYLRQGGTADKLWAHMMGSQGQSADLLAHLRTTISRTR